MPLTHPACEWTGIADDGEAAVLCGKPARGYVELSTGAHHYACMEHAGTIRAEYSGARWFDLPIHPTARPFPESMP